MLIYLIILVMLNTAIAAFTDNRFLRSLSATAAVVLMLAIIKQLVKT